MYATNAAKSCALVSAGVEEAIEVVINQSLPPTAHPGPALRHRGTVHTPVRLHLLQINPKDNHNVYSTRKVFLV